MRVTKHAEKRIRKRVGIPKGSTENVAKKALTVGLKHNETTGTLRRYLDSLYLSHKTANNMRIYGQKTYLFKGETLITVIPLPSKMTEIAKKCFRRKEERQDEECK